MPTHALKILITWLEAFYGLRAMSLWSFSRSNFNFWISKRDNRTAASDYFEVFSRSPEVYVDLKLQHVHISLPSNCTKRNSHKLVQILKENHPSFPRIEPRPSEWEGLYSKVWCTNLCDTISSTFSLLWEKATTSFLTTLRISQLHRLE
jgi:hypothetical protein